MSISDEAVEAAAYALFLDANPDSELQWYDIGFHDQDELMRTARAALCAAAPRIVKLALNDALDDLEDIDPDNLRVWLRERADNIRITQ